MGRKQNNTSVPFSPFSAASEILVVECCCLTPDFHLYFRLWLWKLLQVGRAPLHLVWKPTLRSSRSFRRQRIWRTSPWYMGELALPQKLRFTLCEGLWAFKIVVFPGVTHVLCCFLLAEPWGGSVRPCLRFSAFWWTQFTNPEAESAGGAVPHPVLHVWRCFSFFQSLNVRTGAIKE